MFIVAELCSSFYTFAGIWTRPF